jgi:glycosyltransferase involved in cell wall biosynthesis
MAKKTLHIGLITSEYIIPDHPLSGGLSTYIQKVGRGLVQRGHRVSIFCLSDRNQDWMDQGVSVHEVQGVPEIPPQKLNRLLLPPAEIEKTFKNSARLSKRLWEIHAQDPLNILQAASFQSVGISLCNNGKIPVVTRVSSLESIYRNADGKENTPETALTDWCEIDQIEKSDGCFSPSELMAKYAALLSKANPHVIRTPLDLHSADQDESFYDQNLKDLKYLLFFGTLNKMKGIEIISRAIRPILEEFPDIHLVMVGRSHVAGNDQTYAANLLEKNQVVIPNLHYFQTLPKNKLYPVIRNAYGVLIPSLLDNYPNTCLESIQFGKIVIGTYNSSLDEMIRDGSTGILVQKNDVGSLQAGIRCLLALSPLQIKEMEGSVKEAYNEMIAEDRVGQLIDFYWETINSFHPSKNPEQPNQDGLFLYHKYKITFGLIHFLASVLRRF